nr:NnrS family protein [Asticcacaulis aquaticus]
MGSPHRLFFASAATWACLALILWIGQVGRLLHHAALTPTWHAHEMLWGYFSAVLIGHGLLSVPNHTGKLPVAGTGLLTLWALWLAGRLAMLSLAPAVLKAAIDLSLWALVLFVLMREVLSARKIANLPFLTAILALGGCNLAFHIGLVAVTPRLAICAIVMIITLIGGRMIYSFTENARVERLRMAGQSASGRPMETKLSQHIMSGMTACSLLAWLMAPSETIAAASLLVASIISFMRLGVWFEMRPARDVFLKGMYAAYAWVCVGLMTLATGPAYELIALHILMIGAMFTLTFTIMLRSLLRGVGYPKPLVKSVGWLLLTLQVAVVARVAAILVPSLRMPALSASTAATLIAFIGFLIVLAATRRFSTSPAHRA